MNDTIFSRELYKYNGPNITKLRFSIDELELLKAIFTSANNTISIGKNQQDVVDKIFHHIHECRLQIKQGIFPFEENKDDNS